MLHIERLRIHLPLGFEHRAADIAQQVGGLLAHMDSTHWRTVDSINVPPVTIGHQATDTDIALGVADAIQMHLRGMG